MRTLMIQRLCRLAAVGLLCANTLAPSAWAAGTQTLAVGATILSRSNCKFTGGTSSVLAFGNIDPSSLVNSVATASTTFRCNGSANNATYSIGSDDGLYRSGAGAPRMRHTTDPTRFLPYSLNLPQAATVPKGQTQTLTITGTVLVSDFQNARVGAYSDTVTITLTP